MNYNKQERKERPMFRGLLKYFPDALAEVAHVSYVGNRQHNGDAPMHWAREKSNDHTDCLIRHVVDQGTLDDDGLRHSAKAAWRALAILQLELEIDAANSLPETDADNGADFVEDFPIWIARQESKGIAIGDEAVGMLPPTSAVGDETLEAKVAERLRAAGPEIMRMAEEGHAANQMRNGTTDRDRKITVEIELVKLGCPPEVARQVTGGITFQTAGCAETKWAYISGPMRGYADYNFAAFDAARDRLVSDGYHVISPADIDRHAGYATEGGQTVYVLRDFWALFFLRKQGENNMIYMLDDHENSIGAQAELHLAHWLELEVRHG